MAERANRVEFTLSDEVWARLERARGFEPRASFVKRALEHFLVVFETDPYFKPEREARAPVEKEPNEPVASEEVFPPLHPPSRPAFKCPVARCEFRAGSPAARCGMHGRTVVPDA